MKLFLKTFIRFIIGLILVGVLLFVPAGTLSYTNGWLFLAIPIVLASLWSLLCFLPYVAVIVVRIKSEETVLEKGLAGYAEYKKYVKYRLIPFIW